MVQIAKIILQLLLDFMGGGGFLMVRPFSPLMHKEQSANP